MADVPNTGVGALFAIARDAKGRVVGYKPATITGTANRISVTNGDAIAGLPTVDIDAAYVGQSSITTLGTVTTGTWHASVVGVTYGGTGSDLSTTGGSGQYVKQASTGSALTVGVIPASDIGSGQALTANNDTNVTITLGGTPATALLKASSITMGWTGSLSISRGGTGQTTSSAAFDALSPTTTNQDLIVRGVSSNGRLGVGANGTVLTVTSGVIGWANPATSGTVTSVGLSAPTQFSVSGSPVTTNGTLSLGWSNQSANLVLAGPSTGVAAAPTFRSLVASDIPSLPFSQITGTVPISQGGTGQITANAAYNALSPMTTNGDIIIRSGGIATRLGVGSAGQVLGVSSGLPAWVSASTGTVTSVGLSLPAEFSVSGSPVTSSGTLTGAWASQAANRIFSGPSSGGSASPSFRSLVIADTAWPIDFLEGFRIAYVSANSVAIGPGAAVIPSTGLIEYTASGFTLSGLSLSASTFYHLYLYDNAGTPSVECVSTAPASYAGTAYQKTGDATRRYLGSLLTDASGNIYRFQHNLNQMMYVVATAVAPFRVILNGTSTSRVSSSTSAAMPSTADVAILHIQNLATNSAVLCIDVPESGLTGTANVWAVGSPATAYAPLPVLSRTVIYIYTSAPAGNGAYIDVIGYQFNR